MAFESSFPNACAEGDLGTRGRSTRCCRKTLRHTFVPTPPFQRMPHPQPAATLDLVQLIPSSTYGTRTKCCSLLAPNADTDVVIYCYVSYYALRSFPKVADIAVCCRYS
ncbi:hypothetical protein PMIN01_06574 [Paraphaeosphaeria minitans]|uniref:Uncharacterized protein n=1 Tax=Paraphaeosphaeria minitans TaxID=565426 RepID=A0A9P6GJ77_9PLEO|nr:hypothetical protein PMIN01_06574 [Paraphaeosphaeria minitans]